MGAFVFAQLYAYDTVYLSYFLEGHLEKIFEEAKEALIAQDGEGIRTLMEGVPLKRGAIENGEGYGWTIENDGYQEHCSIAFRFWGEVLRICMRQHIKRDVVGVFTGLKGGHSLYFRGFRFHGYDA